MPPLGHRWEAAIPLSPDHVIARATQASRRCTMEEQTSPNWRSGALVSWLWPATKQGATLSTVPGLSRSSFNTGRDCTRWLRTSFYAEPSLQISRCSCSFLTPRWVGVEVESDGHDRSLSHLAAWTKADRSPLTPSP